jgi:hypothetical protein
MPPVVIWVLGAVGAAAAGRWLYREARRVNAELHREPSAAPLDERIAARKLVRDPRTGEYRPQ